MAQDPAHSFLVLEADSFVREDITEALKYSFSDCFVTEVDASDALSDVIKDVNDSTVVILSETADRLQHSLDLIINRLACSPVVLIGNQSFAVKDADGVVVVPKPFSTDVLISAVRNALSARLSPRT